jgi:hypothetical protein
MSGAFLHWPTCRRRLRSLPGLPLHPLWSSPGPELLPPWTLLWPPGSSSSRTRAQRADQKQLTGIQRSLPCWWRAPRREPRTRRARRAGLEHLAGGLLADWI